MFNFLFVGTKHNHDHDDNMEMKSKMGLTHITTITTVMAAALSCVAEVHGQNLTVSLQSDESYAWNPSTLSCSYTVFDARYNFWNLQWYKGITISDPLAISIADFFGGISSPRLFNGYDDSSKYTVSRDSTSSMSTLHILSVNFTKDSGRYWCRVTVIDPGVSQIQDSDSTEVVVFFLPTSITLSDSNGFFPPTGGKSYLVEGVEHEYTCQVPDINPGASFAWSVGGGGITLGTTSNTTGSDGLITSTGTAILSPTWNNHGQVLQCQASNKNGHAGVSVQVVLDVKVPPKVSRMSLHNSTGSRLNVSVDVDEGKQETFTCKAQSRPAAKMEWFLDDTSQSVIDAPTGGGDGLINTTSTWSLTAVRGNHGQRVKCEASTAESNVNALPSVIVTINVNGPPDNVDISGSTLMTEDVASTLTCTAANAYPEHWSLVWSNVSSNGDIDIPGATLDPPSSTNGRYTFTSRLDLTPSRHDNGNNIKCAARWNSWTPEPQDTFGPLNVQFCTESVNIMQTTAVAGRTASLTCTSETSNPATNLTWSMEGVGLTMPTDQPNTPGNYGGKVTRVTYTTGVLNRTSNGDVYKCCATNRAIPSCVSPLCEMHTLNVLYAPDFQQLILVPDTPIIEGSNVSLTCTVDANPPSAVITWENQGDTLSSVSNGARNTLSLRDVRRQQAGHYTCRANNGVPADNPMDVVSDPVTVIVHYEVNITNKGMTEQGGKDGGSASLTCIAKGNPRPTMQWYGLNNTVITNETDTAKFMVVNVTTGGDGVYGFQVTSTLTINNIDSDMDFGTYTCISTNGIGEEDMLKVNLTGTRRPDKPIRVMITGQTAESLTVTWTAGYNGGEEQSFRVSYLKTLDSTETSVGENVTGGNTTYLVTGLEDYTEYEIRVYAKNIIGENTDYAKVVGHTLPKPPGPDAGIGITVEYNTDEGTVKVTGLRVENSCIQLEVKYEGSDTWQECGKCIASDQTVTLSEWCAASQKRRRRAVGDIEDVRAKLCIGGLCSEAAPAEQVKNPPQVTPPDNRGIIVGAVVGGVVLLAIIIALATYLVRMSPADQKSRRKKTTDSFSNGSDIELQSPSNVAGPEEGNGIANEGVQNHVVYAQVNRANKPTAPLITRPARNIATEYDELSRKERHPVYPNPAVRGDSLPPKTGAYEEMKVAASKTCSENATNKVQENVEKSSPEETVNETTNKVTNRDSKPPITRPKPKSIKKYQPPSRSADGSMADGKPRTTSIKRYTVESGDTYAQVNKNLPPKPKGINPAQNLPDVTYASANKDQKPSLSPLPEDYGAKKKPKKYVPPSARAAEESAYEEVRINDNDNGKSPSAEGDGNTYNSVGAQQDTGGRTANDDGLIYVEVGHARVHPPDQPPIQTEPSTEYASLDFSRMPKKEDKS